MEDKKLICIQGLRGWAIGLIVLWHMNEIFPQCLPSTGGRGAEFFFLISGFLVAFKYAKNDKLRDFRSGISYACGKISKLYSLYLVTMIPMLLLDIRIVMKSKAIGGGQILIKILSSVLLLQSWIPNSEYYWAFNGVTWFLSSLVFCWVFSFIMLKIIKKYDEKYVFITLIMLQFAIETISSIFLGGELSTWLTYICPAYRFLDYSLGMCLYLMYKDYTDSLKEKRGWNLILIGILYFLIFLICDKSIPYTIYHVFECAFFMAVVLQQGKINTFIMENKALVFLGDISMEIFLTHLPVLRYTKIVWEKLFKDKYLPFVEWCIILLLIIIVGYLTQKGLHSLRHMRTRKPVKT